MAKLSARKRQEVFRLKHVRPDMDDKGTVETTSWLAFMDDGTILKKFTYKSWNTWTEKWVAQGTGWTVWKRVGKDKQQERFDFWKETMLAAGWEVAK